MKPVPSKPPAAVELRHMQRKPRQGKKHKQGNLPTRENKVILGNQVSEPNKVENPLANGVEEGITTTSANVQDSRPSNTSTEVEQAHSLRFNSGAKTNCCKRFFILCEVETAFLLLLTITLWVGMFAIFGSYTRFIYWHRAYSLWFFSFASLI